MSLFFRPKPFKDKEGNLIELEDIKITELEIADNGDCVYMATQGERTGGVLHIRHYEDLQQSIEFNHRIFNYKIKDKFPY